MLSQFNVILLVCCLRVITGNSNVTADTRHLINHVRETRETKHEMINSIMFGIIGLAAVSFIIYMIYIYIITLEKQPVFSKNDVNSKPGPLQKNILYLQVRFPLFLRILIANS